MKIETYTELDHRELEALIAEHLDVRAESTSWEGVVAELEAHNGSKEVVTQTAVQDALREIAEGKINWSPKTYQYVAQLVEKGVLPNDHTILIDIWW